MYGSAHRFDWTAFDPVARVAPDALVADGSNFFAYCGYDPVNCVDPMGGWKVPRPIPLPNDGKNKDPEELEMPAEVVTVKKPSGSASTQTSDEEILGEVPVSTWNPQPPTLQDMREADWSGQGPEPGKFSSGPDVATKGDVGYFQNLYVASIASGAIFQNLKTGFLASLSMSYVPLESRGPAVKLICNALRGSNDPYKAWEAIHHLRVTTDPKNTNQSLAQAEHYLWAYSFVKSGSFWWGPMHVANLGWHIVKMAGLASGAEPTSDLLSSGYLGANDALFGNTICADIVYFK